MSFGVVGRPCDEAVLAFGLVRLIPTIVEYANNVGQRASTRRA